MTLKVGDRVEWSSCSAGIRRKKEGVVAYVIPAGERPQFSQTGHRQRGGWGSSRDHESYVIRAIAVGTLSGNAGRTRLYWPLVAHLVQLSAEDPA